MKHSGEYWAHLPPDERRAIGRGARRSASRRSQAQWQPATGRPDPVALLRAQDADRLPDLVPVRYGRMSASPFAFYRGAAAVMAADLAPLPRTGLTVQLCGDAHLLNFGLYASPERTLLFDVNDFDETLPGPFEWDVKRLAASVVVAARQNSFEPVVGRDAALATGRSYREHMATYAEMGELEVWYSRVVGDELLALARAAAKVRTKRTERAFAKARGRDSLQALGKLTEVVDGRRRIVDNPPLLEHVPGLDEPELMHRLFHAYARTLEDDRRVLLERYDFVDLARKVVGVGSVGTRCFVVLLRGRDDDDPLFLQVKQAGDSVLEAYLGRSRFAKAGHRVVAGQRIMQAASDIFLGWMRGPEGRDFYWRQLRDMKGSLETEGMRPAGLELYAEACGWALARGHARSGQRTAIAAYLGVGDRFEQAVADFAVAYADQNERDFEHFTKAIAKGKVEAAAGL
jgi:uncharacterized protein (DUF2252 family)